MRKTEIAGAQRRAFGASVLEILTKLRQQE
jgi:hypothetical protein